MSRLRLLKAVVLLVMAALSLQPAKVLLAEFYSGRANRMLDDKATDYRDVVGLSDESLPLYAEALSEYARAAYLDADNPVYQETLASLSFHMGTWLAMMAQLRSPLTGGQGDGNKYRESSYGYLKNAVKNEPLNARAHLILAKYHAARGDLIAADRELLLATDAYPVNSEVRASVAMQYLLNGDRGKALLHARLLARNDDSIAHMVSQFDDLFLERRSSQYIAILSNSYFYQALEIAWRASGKDVAAVRAITPLTDNTQVVMELFFDAKGVEY